MVVKNSKGISLISLIITIIVIIILAAIVIFSGMSTPEKAQLAKVITDIENVQAAVDQAYYGLYTEKAVLGEVWTDSQYYEAVATGELDRANLNSTELKLIGDNSLVDINLPVYEGRNWYLALTDMSDTIKTGSVVLWPGFELDGKTYATLLDIQNGGGNSNITGPTIGTDSGEQNSGEQNGNSEDNTTPVEPGTYLTNACPDAAWEGQVKVLAEDEITNSYLKNNPNISMVVKTDSSFDTEVPIPVGFTYYLGTGRSGLVIKDAKDNEFVWIPVENAEGTIYETSAEGITLSGSTVKTYKYGTGTNSNWGLPGEEDDKYREPDLITEKDIDSNLSGIGLSVESFANELVNEFDNMTESVKKYKGFYVGRYDLGIDGENIVCRVGVDELTSNNEKSLMWYGLYNACKVFSNTAVQSSMIWGSQWEAMVTFMGNNTTDGAPDPDGTSKKTGEYGDVINHINETRVGVTAWTLTAQRSKNRTFYGGGYYSASRPNTRIGDGATWKTNSVGTRAQLYIKVN